MTPDTYNPTDLVKLGFEDELARIMQGQGEEKTAAFPLLIPLVALGISGAAHLAGSIGAAYASKPKHLKMKQWFRPKRDIPTMAKHYGGLTAGLALGAGAGAAAGMGTRAAITASRAARAGKAVQQAGRLSRAGRFMGRQGLSIAKWEGATSTAGKMISPPGNQFRSPRMMYRPKPITMPGTSQQWARASL